ncbi:MAG: ABC transporter permease [Anaerolineales bacterium]|nr:ABC transporter permease [Anaerolineales bacterium]
MKLQRVRSALRVILCTFEMTLRQNVLDSFILFTILVQPVLIALLAIWMLREQAAEHAIFIVIGSGMTGLWSSLLFISGNSINVERWTGTLENLVASPTPLPWVILGKNLAHVTQSLASMVLSYFLAALIFNLKLNIVYPGAFVLSLFLTVLAFVSFGAIIAPIFVMNPGVQGFQNALEFPIYILCGFLFPIAMLPGWTTPFSYALSPYWAARALHGTSSGALDLSEVLFSWLMLVLFSVGSALLSAFLFRVLLQKARREATLGLE